MNLGVEHQVQRLAQEVTRNMGPLRLEELRWLRDVVDGFIEDEERERGVTRAAPPAPRDGDR